MSKFTMNVKDSQRFKGRRGLQVMQKFRKDGVIVGELDDQPEAIVAHVTFTSPEIRAEFLAEAKEAMSAKFVEDYGAEMAAGFGEEMYISEYARKMSEETDLAHNAMVIAQRKAAK